MRRSGGLVLALALFFVTSGSATELDQFGKAHAWKGQTDRYTVVDFAASWCGPCWKTLPELQAVADLYKDLRVLVVSVDQEETGRDRLVEGLSLRVPVLWDEDYAIAEHYEPVAMPATFVLAPSGDVIYNHSGSNKKDWESLVALLESLPLAASETESITP